MIMEIHSKFGVYKCRELEKQAIEESIPEGQDASYQDTEDAVNLADE